MKTKTQHRKEKLKKAMKLNIMRRLESQNNKENNDTQNDIEMLKQKISYIKKNNFEKSNKTNAPYFDFKSMSVISVIIDLFSGGIAGSIIGYGIKIAFFLKSYIVIIICFALGIMGGFYNIIKKNEIS